MKKELTIKKKIINYLENQINSIETQNAQMAHFAQISPFNNSIDIESEKEKLFKRVDDRIKVHIYQKDRIVVLKSVLEDVRRIK